MKQGKKLQITVREIYEVIFHKLRVIMKMKIDFIIRTMLMDFIIVMMKMKMDFIIVIV